MCSVNGSTAAELLTARMLPVLIALAVLGSTSVRADAWNLLWTRGPGADGCIDGADVAAAVERRLGRSVFVDASIAQRTAEGRIMKEEGGWRAVFSVQNAQNIVTGTREYQASTERCSDIADAVTFIMAVLIDAQVPVETEKVRRPLRVVQAELPTVEQPKSGIRLEFDFGALFGIGKLADPTAGLRIGAYGALPGGAGLEMAIETWLPVRGSSSMAVDVAVCPAALRTDRFLLTGCGSVGAGALFTALEQVSPFFDLGFRARAGWALTKHFGITAGVSLGVRLPQPRLTFEAGAALSVRLW